MHIGKFFAQAIPKKCFRFFFSMALRPPSRSLDEKTIVSHTTVCSLCSSVIEQHIHEMKQMKKTGLQMKVVAMSKRLKSLEKEKNIELAKRDKKIAALRAKCFALKRKTSTPNPTPNETICISETDTDDE